MAKEYTHMRVDIDTKERLKSIAPMFGNDSMLDMLRYMLDEYEKRVDEGFETLMKKLNKKRDEIKKSKEEK